MRDQDHRDQKHKYNNNISANKPKSRGSGHTNSASDHASSCMVLRRKMIIVGKAGIFYISFCQKLYKSAEKEKKYKSGQKLLICDPVMFVRHKKSSSHKKRSRKHIGHQSHNAEADTTDLFSYCPANSKITDHQDHGRGKNDQKNDLCLKSACHTLLFGI